MSEFDNYVDGRQQLVYDREPKISDDTYVDTVQTIGPFVTRLTKRNAMSVARQKILHTDPRSGFMSLFYSVILGFIFTEFATLAEYVDSINIYSQFIVNILAIYFGKPIRQFNDQRMHINSIMTNFIKTMLPLMAHLRRENKHLLERQSESATDPQLSIIRTNIANVKAQIKGTYETKDRLLLEFLVSQNQMYHRSSGITNDPPTIHIFDVPKDTNDWWGSLYGTNFWLAMHMLCGSVTSKANTLLLDGPMQSIQYFIGCGECREHYIQRGIPFLESLRNQGFAVDKQLIVLHQFVYMDSLRELHKNFVHMNRHANLLQPLAIEIEYPQKYMLNDYYIRGLQLDYRAFWAHIEQTRDATTADDFARLCANWSDNMVSLMQIPFRIPKTIGALHSLASGGVNGLDHANSAFATNTKHLAIVPVSQRRAEAEELYDQMFTKQYMEQTLLSVSARSNIL